MFNIDSKTMKPDLSFWREENEKLFKQIRVGNVEELLKEFQQIMSEMVAELKVIGIHSVGSVKEIQAYMESTGLTEVYEIAYIDGKWSTQKDVLQRLAVRGYDFAKFILIYRKAKSYADACQRMLKSMDKHRIINFKEISYSITNRAFPKEPSIMSIPKELLWNLIVPRKDGNILVSLDIKNQEPHILAHILNIQPIKDRLNKRKGLYEALFEEIFKPMAVCNVWRVSEEDKKSEGEWLPSEMEKEIGLSPTDYSPYRETTGVIYYRESEEAEAVRVVGLSPLNIIVKGNSIPEMPGKVTAYLEGGEEVECVVLFPEQKKSKKLGKTQVLGEIKGLEVHCTGVYRDDFKTAWNMLSYGAARNTVVEMCRNIDANRVVDFMQDIKELREYRSWCSKKAKEKDREVETYFGTKIRASGETTSEIKRSLLDIRFQGTGTDIMALLLEHLQKEIQKRGLQGKVCVYFNRADEYILEVDREYYEQQGWNNIKKELKEMAEHQVDDWLPFRVEITRPEPTKFTAVAFVEDLVEL